MDFKFKTLNYLGSKYRLLDFIRYNIFNVTHPGDVVCDLFAGSGCVSYNLSGSFPVIACDIQNYSKVICNALLFNYNVSDKSLIRFFNVIENGYEEELLNAFKPLISLEENAIDSKDSEILTDILEHGSVEVFNIERAPSSIEDVLIKVSDNLLSAGLMGDKSLISRYYGGIYFSYKQAVEIDILLEAINKLISTQNRDLFLATLLSTASEIVDTVGKHFAQPIKARDSKGRIKSTVYNKAVKDKTMDVFALYKSWLLRYLKLPRTKFDCKTTQADYLQCLNSLPPQVRTVYADPPYTREHYSRFYHVLETMTLRDNPKISKVTIHGKSHISNGIYRENRFQSPFCIRSKAPEAFKKMFESTTVSNRNLLLSYSPYDENKKSQPRVVTMKQLVEWANEYYDNVEIVSAGTFRHSKLNSTEHFLEAEDESELLIICTNK